ncbi:hypothetical protein BCR39DRAFT_550253 [Naematelia encephala]|uniref:Uncharacterized protein n=1 Tax=Naematelia encephala TaxID=71784 RepID=A0A1Y2AL00_9TREE|nr:hypothetical protein BCR39DRAFT_550253 [Naematelia encephala]
MSTATTDNYFTIAKEDDNSASHVPALDSTDTPRVRRIAAAVERSRLEYLPEHAYVEREWFLKSSPRSHIKPKIDRQCLEYTTTKLYCRGEYAKALEQILEAFQTTGEPEPMSQELLDIGIRSAIGANDPVNAVGLARLGKSSWKRIQAGGAATAADAFNFANLPFDAFEPLITSISTFGLQAPILERLLATIDRVAEKSDVLKDFRSMVLAAKMRRQEPGNSIFETSIPSSSLPEAQLDRAEGTHQVDDVVALALALRLENDVDLRGALLRLGKGAGDVETKAKGVREL